ncbi:restriction endonuclease subunit S, partial [Staphylococcus epidermidis]
MEFNKYKLKDLTVNGKGEYGIGAPAVKYSPNLYKYLRITDIDDNGFINTNQMKSINDKNEEKYLLKANDIVFARTGNSTGKSYFYNSDDGPLVYAGFLIKFSLDPTKLNPKYLRYYTLTNEYKGWINQFSIGSTRKNINAKIFGDMVISLPPRYYQDFVVDILDSLERKVKINKQMVANLEELSQTLFKHWFVDFEFPDEDGNPYKSSGGEMIDSELGEIPPDWKVGVLSDMTEIIMGQSPKSDTYNNNKVGLPLLNGASDFKNRNIKPTKYTSAPKKIGHNLDYVFGVRATIGLVTELDGEYAIGRGAGLSKNNEEN